MRILAVALVLLTVAAFCRLPESDFIFYDDREYITDNPEVHKGLTPAGFVWAFGAFHVANWHPLSWLSHMLDCQLYGLNPAGHHLTSLILHIVNTLLLFLLLRESTARLRESFLVAALFAVHPLHVESVAWVSERKDVLSTALWFLTLLAYQRYTWRGGRWRYLAALGFFGAGLMAKPMLVTLPFVLLLWDHWPLGRLAGPDGKTWAAFRACLGKMLVEKLPFFALSAGSCIITVMAQSRWNAVRALEDISLGARVGNALLSYVRYMGKTVWPENLAIFYPHPGMPGGWEVAACAILLALLLAGAFYQFRQRPYLAVGGLWFLGTLLPVIGLVQVGVQAMADRYTYVPVIGLFLAGVWGLEEIFDKGGVRRNFVRAFWGAVLAACLFGTFAQVRVWKNTLTLFQHATQVTADNYLAHYLISLALAERGDRAGTAAHYTRALQINPEYIAMMQNVVGYRFALRGYPADAEPYFHEALRIRPVYPRALNNLGVVLLVQGRVAEAAIWFEKALTIAPNFRQAQVNLSNARRQLAIDGVSPAGGRSPDGGAPKGAYPENHDEGRP